MSDRVPLERARRVAELESEAAALGARLQVCDAILAASDADHLREVDRLHARVAELEAEIERLDLAERVIAVLRGRSAPSAEHSWREWHRMLVEWDAGET